MRISGRLVTVGHDDSCDFVCDGIADNVQIQQAIDYVAKRRKSKIIELASGIFDIQDSIDLASNLMLVGNGINKTKLEINNELS